MSLYFMTSSPTRDKSGVLLAGLLPVVEKCSERNLWLNPVGKSPFAKRLASSNVMSKPSISAMYFNESIFNCARSALAIADTAAACMARACLSL